MLMVGPGAFRYQEYRGMPLQEIRAIIADVRMKYPVDPDRIYIQGISLGGRGALEVAALLPDTFAGVSAHGVYGVQRQ
ncbi:MAG: alpha/beta hydrolase-fold protein [Planctomycetota bacterium]